MAKVNATRRAKKVFRSAIHSGKSLAAILLTCGPTQLVHADGTQLDWEIALTSDFVDRGVSQSMSEAAFQAGVTAELENGFYAYAWASTIDYTPSGMADDGAHLELDTGVGYWWSLSDAVYLDVGWTRYTFPGTVDGVRYNYSEWSGTLGVGEMTRITINVSDNIYNSRQASLHAVAETGIGLPWDLTLDFAAGYFDLESAFDSSYAYGIAGLSRTFGPVTARLEYDQASDEAAAIFGTEATGSRWVVSLSAALE